MFRILVVAAALCVAVPPVAGQGSAAAASSHIVTAQALPSLDGTRLEATLVEVTFPPGGVSAPHSHPCAVLGYVIRGAVRMQVEGGPLSVYTPGQSFYEAPNGVHAVSANASQTEPATFVAYFTCDKKMPALSVPPPTR